MFVKLAVEFARSTSGEQASSAHQPRGYTNVRLSVPVSIKFTDLFFNPESRHFANQLGKQHQRIKCTS